MVKSMERPNAEIDAAPIVFHEPVPTLFIDGFKGVTIINDVVRMNLVQNVSDPEAEKPYKKCVARLVLSLSAFHSVAKTMAALTGEFREQGFFPEGTELVTEVAPKLEGKS